MRNRYKCLYWMRGYNFGDALNPLLFEAMTGSPPVFVEDGPKILAIGSIIHKAGPGDIIWGAGCISASRVPAYDPSIEIRMLRGPRTAKVLAGLGFAIPHNPVYGCPAWLLPRYFPGAARINHEIGFLPHYIDWGQIQGVPSQVHVMNTALPPQDLIKEITGCRVMVSSSLHGIIVAEAYGIPAVWVELADNIEGGGFKFHDYYEGTGRDIKPLDWRKRYDWDRATTLGFSSHFKVTTEDRINIMAVCPFEGVKWIDKQRAGAIS